MSDLACFLFFINVNSYISVKTMVMSQRPFCKPVWSMYFVMTTDLIFLFDFHWVVQVVVGFRETTAPKMTRPPSFPEYSLSKMKLSRYRFFLRAVYWLTWQKIEKLGWMRGEGSRGGGGTYMFVCRVGVKACYS